MGYTVLVIKYQFSDVPVYECLEGFSSLAASKEECPKVLCYIGSTEKFLKCGTTAKLAGRAPTVGLRNLSRVYCGVWHLQHTDAENCWDLH